MELKDVNGIFHEIKQGIHKIVFSKDIERVGARIERRIYAVIYERKKIIASRLIEIQPTPIPKVEITETKEGAIYKSPNYKLEITPKADLFFMGTTLKKTIK